MPNKVILKAGEYKDRTGERSGAWTFLAFDHKDHDGRAHWQMICDCGVGRIAAPKSAGYSDECTHQTHTVLVARNKRWRETKLLNQEINGWKVIQVHEGGDPHFNERALPVLCECLKCGTHDWHELCNLKTGRILCRECPFESVIHGQILRRGVLAPGTKTANLFKRWQLMNERCASPTYPRYGARGITVCDEWHLSNPNGFTNYFEWVMKEYPNWEDLVDLKYEVDRRDNERGYSPENCRWVSRIENARNKSRSRIVEYNGESIHLKSLLERLNCDVSADSIWYRMKTRGVSFKEALNLMGVTLG